jgi:lipopolysaccharide transport system permease protein
MVDEIKIEAGRGATRYWRDLWEYRELFYFLAWRDILVRYKQTVIGIAWSVLRPLLTMIVFTIVFGKIARLPSGGVPYAILVLSALLPWQFFSNALSESGTSLLNNSNLISKVYFPRMIVPASAIITSLVDFVISAVLLAGLMVWYRYVPDWRIILIPVFAFGAFITVAGMGLWAAALTVKYRDFRIVVPFLVQFGFFISPVGYSSAVVPDQWRLLYSLNPMVGIIDGFRWTLLRDTPLFVPGLVLSSVVAILFLATGIVYFRRTEKNFADVI